MRTHKKVMIGALLLFMMMAANFHNALNDYGIRSNAFMNGVIASGSNGSGSGSDNQGKWDAEYPRDDCKDMVVIKTRKVEVIIDGIPVIIDLTQTIKGNGDQRICTQGPGVCLFDDSSCCLVRFFGICTDHLP